MCCDLQEADPILQTKTLFLSFPRTHVSLPSGFKRHSFAPQGKYKMRKPSPPDFVFLVGRFEAVKSQMHPAKS